MSRTRALMVLAFVTVAIRLAVLAWPGPDLSEGGRVMAEEVVRGVTAREVLEGPLLDIQDYQQPFWGGHVAVAVMAAPAFAVLGSNLFALRLATLPFALLLALSGFALLDRFAGRRAAWIGGLWLALPPPGFLLLSCTLQGTHAESVALSVATVLLMVRAVEAPSQLRTVLFGVACGFDLWFGYPALFGPVWVALGLIVTTRALPPRSHVALWLGSVIVGAAPWLRLSVAEQPSTRIYGLSTSTWFDPARVLDQVTSGLRELTTQDFPLSLWLPGSVQGSIGVFAFFLAYALLAAWGFGLWTNRAGLASAWRPRGSTFALRSSDWLAWLVLLPAVPTAFLLTSNFELGPRDWLQNLRYLLPVWPLMAFGVACAFARLPRAVGIACTVVVLSVFGWGTIERSDAAAFGRDLHVDVAPVRTHARIVAWWHRNDAQGLETAVERIGRRSEAEQEEFLHALGLWNRWWYVQAMSKNPPREADARRSLDVLQRLHAYVAPRWKPFFVAYPDDMVPLSETVEAFRARHPTEPTPSSPTTPADTK